MQDMQILPGFHFVAAAAGDIRVSQTTLVCIL